MHRITMFGVALAAVAFVTADSHGQLIDSVFQEVVVAYDEDPSSREALRDDRIDDHDRDRSDTFVLDNGQRVITHSLLAEISGPGYDAVGSVGEFGSYGVSGHMIHNGVLYTHVFFNSTHTLPSIGAGGPVEANFIIDGGFVNFVAGPASTLDFYLLVGEGQEFPPIHFPRDPPGTFIDPDLDAVVFESEFRLEGSESGDPTLTVSGDDIAVTQNTFDPSQIEIPLSFQSVDLGVRAPGERINLLYLMLIAARVHDFAETVSFGFSDPLTINPPPVDPSMFRPTVAFVPEPSSAAVTLLLLGGFVTRRRRILPSK